MASKVGWGTTVYFFEEEDEEEAELLAADRIRGSDLELIVLSVLGIKLI
jgi:hypothetical protein